MFILIGVFWSFIIEILYYCRMDEFRLSLIIETIRCRELRYILQDKNSTETQKFNNSDSLANSKVRDILCDVYYALKEKGYHPVNQIVGYIMSGDPTYITNHKKARNLISKLERDELLENIVYFYINRNLPKE